jgi:rRNA maturation endonuclease Nob1
MSMQTDAQERLLSKGMDSGSVDSQTVQEFLRQQTMQKGLDRESDKVAALSEAEKARYETDTYKSAEDREREHQLKQTDSDAKLMEAAKQNVPDTLVQGATSTSVSAHVTTKEKKSDDIDWRDECPNCGKSVESDSEFCPHCGSSMK